VAILLGKTVNSGWGAYAAVWARTMLLCLVGALEVPGGALGTNVKLNRPANNRLNSATPGPDGFMHYPFNETTKDGWHSKPHIRNAYRTLVPLASHSPWSPALGPAHLPWLFQDKPPDHWPKPTMPDIWFCYRTNPAISSWNAPEVAKRVAEFPFVVAFAYTLDETNYMADVLLPDATDLEGLQLIQVGGSKFIENYWLHEGWTVRQPIGDPGSTPGVDCKDMTEISTELARRTGMLKAYNEAINRGAAGIKLKGDGYDYRIDPEESHDREVIWDRVAMAASHDLTDGKEVHGIEWFKQHGFLFKPFSQLEWYLYPRLRQLGLRFELPYQERIKRHGTQLANRLHEVGVQWWNEQLEEYEALPGYQPFPDIFTNYAREVGRDPAEFPFWAITARSMQYSWGANVGIPLINEVAQHIAGHQGVIINADSARKLKIAEGDPVVIESVVGASRGFAVLRQGIRPDTVLMIGQFDHWATPFAKEFKLASLNSVTPLALSMTDATGSGSDLVRVKVSKGEGPGRAAA
jgi:phenylacetyl-CoA:acceptor oxidoreductase